jgi:RNA polymerase sigma-70 factor (ECF subfamily)
VSERSTRDAEDARLLEGIRGGDEAAFTALVRRYTPQLLRVARMYAPSRAVAEEAVQETWIGVMRGAERFEGRSSVKTWLFRILANVARTKARKEGRSIPFSSAAPAREDPGGPAVDADRFLPPDDARAPGAWATPPSAWPVPEERLLEGEARDLILREIAGLPPAQREVITLRDIEGWSSEDVRNALEITDTNQRVLLHRARSRVRSALESYFSAVEPVR